MTVKKPIPKSLLQPITTGANSTMNQPELPVTCSSAGKICGAIGFRFASCRLKYSDTTCLSLSMATK